MGPLISREAHFNVWQVDISKILTYADYQSQLMPCTSVVQDYQRRKGPESI